MAPERLLLSPDETAAAGAELAGRLGPGDLVCLWGPLGAGKSTFARGLLRALAGAEIEAPSPTFTLVQHYASARLQTAHVDLYRVRSAEEAEELGLEEALDAGAVLLEWPERLGPHLPEDRLDVELEPVQVGDQEARRLRVLGRGRLQERFPA